MARNHPFHGATSVGYFCDESSHTNLHERYLSVGAIAIPREGYADLAAELVDIRNRVGEKDRWGQWLEIKWNNTPPAMISAQTEFAKVLARARKARKLNFHVIFCDRERFGDNDIRDTLGKLYWQLILRKAVYFYGAHCPIHVRPDIGPPTDSILKYRHHLSAKGKKLFQTRAGCVESIEKLDSKKSLVMQLLDVTLGAFTAMKNKRAVGPHKARLMNVVHEQNGSRNLDISTNPAYNGFSLWNFIPYAGDEDDEVVPRGLS